MKLLDRVTPLPCRDQFLERLRKPPRQLWLGDERVGDVTEHPALAGAAQTLAAVFDRQCHCADECLVADPDTGEPTSISHVFPRSIEDLRRRNRGLARVSEATVGLMGRTPDYMNVKFASFAARPAFWAGPDRRTARGAEANRAAPTGQVRHRSSIPRSGQLTAPLWLA
jgi:aromatic ring hydroxylase